LAFTADPDYRYMLGLFEGCLERNGFEIKTPDYIWNKNRLVLEKEQLKANISKIITKDQRQTTTKKEGEDGGNGAEDQGKQQQ